MKTASETRNQKAGARPAGFSKAYRCTGCPGGAKAPPGLEGYFFFDFLAFFAFFAFFAFLAIASSFGLMEGNATRGMLGEGYSLATASMTIPTDSQAAAPRCHLVVIALSTVVTHFWRVFAARDASSRKFSGAVNERTAAASIRARVKDASSGLRIVHRFGARAAVAFFTNSKPHPGLYGRGESPLSGAVACSTIH
ncbi:MAG TPA: hypothetical protein VFH41_04885 [Bradyrhizobium sp.]|nr:hypothetical protein [Bradyrhizobium sp.]